MPVAQAEAVSDWFAAQIGPFVTGLINVAIIIVLAVVLRFVAHRLITRLVNRIISSHQRLNQTKTRASRAAQETSQDAAHREERRAAHVHTVGGVLGSVATVVIFGVAFVMILAEFGISIGPILASAGVLGLAIGFGAQSLVQDFLAGLFMMLEDQFGVGDVIDAGDAVGTVEAMTLRITKIRDLDGGLWHVRNGEILRVCNMNQDWANAVVELPLDYSVDIAHAKRVIEDGLQELTTDPEIQSQVLDQPDVSGVVGIGNGAVTMRIIIKTKPGAQWALGRAVRAHLKQVFDREGIKVAYPVMYQQGSGATQQG
ncbi:mechanosensitive ion channel domain-containing protein [Haloechinothrix sp. LS1_15]|uniref:mechanosensitive ion channel family protein n=1 Tax=Haloechinothrix sp. LS1_15 TaxID=2652248 RepID=UPI0029452622|nr:mechanosensitive ion channel domain-containing protein [Haloechinothrix sp. LS1_15]MDV6012116.1 mechanosensitive ion channel [Haloechinothrix sp. LS1_15]